MDIQFAYNLERMLYYVTNENTSLVSDIMQQVERQYQYCSDAHGVTLDPAIVQAIQEVFLSCAVTDEQTLETMKTFYEQHHFLLCPHSAISVYGALHPFAKRLETETLICVLTAHPAKFESSVVKALGDQVSVKNDKVVQMMQLPHKYKWLRINSTDPSVWRREWKETIKQDVEAVQT